MFPIPISYYFYYLCLSYVVSREGIIADPDKVAAVQGFSSPTTVRNRVYSTEWNGTERNGSSIKCGTEV